ncbi:MAG: phage integrase N-terminal SAM-like domain-containing protein [Rubrivivax sp.]|nr:phage integrase N-terminal SAM-like domain-containing protein [Rubrivivax sp.]
MTSSRPVRRPISGAEQSTTTLPKYLIRRGNALYFKRRIPADVAHGFTEFREQVWKSLGTHLVEQARPLLAVEITEFDLRVAQLRREAALRTVSDQRDGQPQLVALTSGSPPGQSERVEAPVVPARAQAAEAAQENRSSAHAMRKKPDALSVHPQAPPRSPLALVANRPEATPTPSPSAAGPKPRAKAITSPSAPGLMYPGTTMLHLFEHWKLDQARPRTVGAVQRAVMQFRALHGPLPVETITRQHARAYRDSLIERQLSKGTVENAIGFLSTLVRHGMLETVENLATNPFERILVNGAKGLRAPKDRRAYEVSELNTLFSSKLYTQGYRPKGQASDAAYWVPLLGPFAGPRIEEACQLRVADVQRINGVWSIRICDIGEDQNVKTASSFRRVPLHEELVKAGFLAYVARVAASGADRVFPTLSNDNANGIYSNSVGKWYGRYLQDIGLTDSRLDYHSFRYAFKQQCSLCNVEEETRDALAGHWLNGRDASRTYLKREQRQYPFTKLVAAIRLLRYDGLRLSHLAVDDPMAGVEEHLLT